MKLVLAFSFLFIFSLAGAQQVILKKGQQIIVYQADSMDADMGVPMQRKMEMVMKISVNDEKENGFALQSIINSIKFHVDVMGQEQSYNSDSSKDRDSDIGKQVGQVIGKPANMFVNKMTGKVYSTDSSKTPKEDDLLSALSQNPDGNSLAEPFMVLTTDNIRKGKWSVSDSTKYIQSTTVYSVVSLNKNEATIHYETTAIVNTTVEQQGISMNIKLNSSTKGEIISDVKTSLVKKRNAEQVFTGTAEAMGQPMEMSGKSKSNITYELL